MYVDSFLTPVPKKNLKKYIALAKTSAKIYMKYGALEYNECVADDVKPGKVTSFPQAVKRKAGETIFIAWAVYKSRAHRDSVMKKVMNDPFYANFDMSTLPFDGMRMMWGGFKSAVSVKNKR